MQKTFTQLLITALNVGVVLTSTHGALTPANATTTSNTVDFATKVHAELHTHSDHSSTHRPMNDQYLDPKSLRRVRSENDKLAGVDSDNGWNAYDGWVGISS